MNFIYKITNITNNKVYIGQTARTVKERWHEHQKNAYQLELKRPLYHAMRKYGIENFTIEIIEEVADEQTLNERETYWIEYYDSYGRGYNATKGGDGSYRIDYEQVIQLYEKLQNAAEVARQMNICVDSVRDTLHRSGISMLSAGEISASRGTKIDQLDKKTLQVIKTFNSLREAAMEVKGKGGGVISHIHDACKGIRQSAYGYKWRFHIDE